MPNARPKKLTCNADLIADLMAYSKSGPLMEVFIMQSLREAAQRTIDNGPSRTLLGLAAPQVWDVLARELRERCDDFYNRDVVNTYDDDDDEGNEG